MVSVQVRGGEKLTKLAAILTEHAEGRTIRNRLRRVIRDQSKHITKEQRENLAAKMPHRGGLSATLLTGGRYTISTSLAGKSATVTIVDAWKGHDMKAIDRGLIRHPVFGRWLQGQRPQAVPPGLLTQPVMRNQLRLRYGIVRSLDALAAEIAKET